jgi:hypothetical protein
MEKELEYDVDVHTSSAAKCTRLKSTCGENDVGSIVEVHAYPSAASLSRALPSMRLASWYGNFICPGTFRRKAYVASITTMLFLSVLSMGITPTRIGNLKVRPYYNSLKDLADRRSLMSRDVNGIKPQPSTSTVANLLIAPKKVAQPRLNISTFSCLNLVNMQNPTTSKLQEKVFKEQLEDGLTYIGKEPFQKYLGMEHVSTQS